MATPNRAAKTEQATGDLLGEVNEDNTGSDQLSQTPPDAQDSLTVTMASGEPEPADQPHATGEAAPDKDENAISKMPELTHEEVDRLIAEDENLSDTPLNRYRTHLVNGGLQQLVDRGQTDEQIIRRLRDCVHASDPEGFLKGLWKEIRSNKRAQKKAGTAALDRVQEKTSSKENKG